MSYIEAVKDEIWDGKSELLLKQHSDPENKELYE